MGLELCTKAASVEYSVCVRASTGLCVCRSVVSESICGRVFCACAGLCTCRTSRPVGFTLTSPCWDDGSVEFRAAWCDGRWWRFSENKRDKPVGVPDRDRWQDKGLGGEGLRVGDQRRKRPRWNLHVWRGRGLSDPAPGDGPSPAHRRQHGETVREAVTLCPW